MWIVKSNVSSVQVGPSPERNKFHASFSLTKGLRSKPQGTQLWRLRWHSLCAMRGNMKLEASAVFCATWMCVTLTESWGDRTCSVVVIWIRRSWQLANTRVVRNPLSSYFSRACHQSRATCYPALRVLSSKLSVSVMRVDVAQKTAGASSFKLRRIASLMWSTTSKNRTLSQATGLSSRYRNVRLYYPYLQYTNLLIFRFVSEHSLRSKRLFTTMYIL